MRVLRHARTIGRRWTFQALAALGAVGTVNDIFDWTTTFGVPLWAWIMLALVAVIVAQYLELRETEDELEALKEKQASPNADWNRRIREEAREALEQKREHHRELCNGLAERAKRGKDLQKVFIPSDAGDSEARQVEWSRSEEEWEGETGRWLEEQLGPAARVRFEAVPDDYGGLSFRNAIHPSAEHHLRRRRLKDLRGNLMKILEHESARDGR